MYTYLFILYIYIYISVYQILFLFIYIYIIYMYSMHLLSSFRCWYYMCSMTTNISHSFNGIIWIAGMQIGCSCPSRAALGGIEVWAICQDTMWPARLQIPRAACIEPREDPQMRIHTARIKIWEFLSFLMIFKYDSWFPRC